MQMSKGVTVTENLSLVNARVVTPDSVIEDGRVSIEDGRITEIDSANPRGPRPRIDVEGRLVVPGFIDLHGDDLERHLHPRDGTRVETRMALASCDRANVAAGITTKYHAVAFEEAPGENRSIELASHLAETIPATDGLLADTRVHARCELGDDGCSETVASLVGEGGVDMVSLMHHAPGHGQFADFEQFSRKYATGTDSRSPETGGQSAVRQVGTHRREQSHHELVSRLTDVVEAANRSTIPVAAHDLEDEETVASLVEQGVQICEFPTTLEAARRAKSLGVTTTMGAPNLVRGGSLWGNLDVSRAIETGVLDALCTDYHPQSLLQSLFVETGNALPEKVARVTSAPADAVGLTDRGRIQEGARADLLVIDPDPVPTVKRVFKRGAEVFRTADHG